MITVITEEVLEAAREMNRRDVHRAEQIHEGSNEDTTEAGTPEEEDDKIWAKYEGIEGLKGAEGQPLKVGGSHYSYGLYSRNRRILADVALAADWEVEKARILEQRCTKSMVQHMERSKQPSDVSNVEEPMRKNGRSFTFQDISWSYLLGFIEWEVKQMDPTKLAVVKAAVLDLYPTNSKKDVKNIPVYSPRTMRRSDDAVPVSEADIDCAQQELDKVERRRKANRMMFRERDSYVPPEKVKLRIKAFLKAKDMSENEFCRAIDVTEDEFESFMSARKRDLQLESKVFHDAVPYMRKENGEEEPPRKRQKQLDD
ncbi:hypothetical protein F4821DRAFT_172669 [Hypoxylon rubiginosum]|uniref:Uncharacterized protein n=1 Tax=Hypoxylon rubiginosum TaxID=110542 RepID=A0ACC0DGU4_9PEZI|nr:hypothetical protein F4821DRAFT_172669 [Hypoxylon rubiginosum]